MGHYTGVPQAVSRMTRKPGRKLEKIETTPFENRKDRMKNQACHFAGTFHEVPALVAFVRSLKD